MSLQCQIKALHSSELELDLFARQLPPTGGSVWVWKKKFEVKILNLSKFFKNFAITVVVVVGVGDGVGGVDGEGVSGVSGDSAVVVVVLKIKNYSSQQ